MGQAKLRGSFEERKAMAIQRNKETAERRRIFPEEHERKKTPEQIRREQEFTLELASILNIAQTAYRRR